jgi:hypothetical protein
MTKINYSISLVGNIHKLNLVITQEQELNGTLPQEAETIGIGEIGEDSEDLLEEVASSKAIGTAKNTLIWMTLRDTKITQ